MSTSLRAVFSEFFMLLTPPTLRTRRMLTQVVGIAHASGSYTHHRPHGPTDIEKAQLANQLGYVG
jgi:hypothetical protein